jgi:uncharacterized protein YkwD
MWSRSVRALCAATMAVGSMIAAVQARADDGDQGLVVLNQVNATRALNGCGPVTADPQLTAAAMRRAGDALADGHTGSDGSSIAQRVTDAGYAPYSALGEVVFWGTGAAGNPADAVASWMNSPAHRAIITDCRFTDAGFSSARSGEKVTVTGDFGQR